MSGKRIRLVVVDDHTLFRSGLVSLLSEMAEFEVVGEAGDGQQALELIQNCEVDILLLDVNMPRLDGVATVAALRSLKNPVRVLMLSVSQDTEDLLGAIRAGANGYILKNTEPEDLRKALLRVAKGQGALSPEVTAPVLQTLARSAVAEAPPLITDREQEVLYCLVKGLTTQQIAGQLYISENTVKTHIRHILEKLEASNRTEAVGKAIQMGLLQRIE